MPARMSFTLPNTQKPTSGPVAIPVALDFTSTDNVTGDLVLEQSQGVIEFVQSIYINNKANTKSLTIIFGGLAYDITIKAGQQGMFPVLVPNGSISWKATSVGAALLVPTIMYNVEQAPFLWQAV
jgi:hypothetical protein